MGRRNSWLLKILNESVIFALRCRPFEPLSWPVVQLPFHFSKINDVLLDTLAYTAWITTKVRKSTTRKAHRR